MSNIPLARQILHSTLVLCPHMPKEVKQGILLALRNMTREKPVHHAIGKRVKLDAVLKSKVRKLANTNPDVTYHEIANLTGIRNTGRISEILTRKR